MNGSNQFVALKVIVFTLIVIAGFTYYANSIPQIESQPPKELSLSKEGLTPEALVAAGKDIFYGKGTCALCHGVGQKGPRAPDLDGIGARATNYDKKSGGKYTAKEYLIESLIEPATYLVEGYPPIMPVVNKPPIGLNQTEVLALVAFLESLGGTVDVKPEDVPSESPVADATAASAAPASLKLPGDPEAGKVAAEVCVQCHVIPGFRKPRPPRGPDLSAIGAIQTPDYIIEAILNPDAVVVAGFKPGLMPKDFGEKLKAQEFFDLMAFLLTLKGGPPQEGGSAKPAAGGTENKASGTEKAPATTEIKPAEAEKPALSPVEGKEDAQDTKPPAPIEAQPSASQQSGTSTSEEKK
jgi:mono/diheme cytochrome c family protein